MCGVTSEKDRSVSESIGDGRVKAVDRDTIDLELLGVPPRRQEPRDEISFEDLLARFVGLQTEFPATARAMTRYERTNSFGVTMLASPDGQW